jgi:hypothetical protein
MSAVSIESERSYGGCTLKDGYEAIVWNASTSDLEGLPAQIG